MKRVNSIIITQARIGSKRFPKKILNRINDNSILGIHLYRLKKVILANNIIVATTKENEVDKIINETKKHNIQYFKGSTNDVLDRFYKVSLIYCPDYIIRVTSDCPLIDPNLVDKIIDFTVSNKLDYCSNTLTENFPDGQDIEVFKFKCLLKAWESATTKSDREHVTPFIKRNSSFYGGKLFKSNSFPSKFNFGDVRMTIDEPEDLNALKFIIDNLGIDSDWKSYTSFIINNHNKMKNQQIKRGNNYLKIDKN